MMPCESLGLPRQTSCIIVPDNAPTATYRPVKNKPGRRIQERYADFADYYDLLLVPARPGKPRDKAAVERAVQLVWLKCGRQGIQGKWHWEVGRLQQIHYC